VAARSCQTVLATGGPAMLATELLFVYVYCLIDDAMKAGVLVIPRRPGPVPACTDAELLTIAVVRHLLGRRSENGFLAEIRGLSSNRTACHDKEPGGRRLS
ncbi:MAG: hypothetical protein ACRDNT_02820, partial [Streptosporangiaceae bacterium]